MDLLAVRPDVDALALFLPVMAYVALYSLLPHKVSGDQKRRFEI
jgi:hypothetical protein